MKNYLDDIKKYVSDVDEKAAHKIANNLQLVMHDPDARFVATTQKSEMDLVVNNFAIKKLNVSEQEAKQAVERVAEIMKAEREKNRITFYYLVAKELGKLSFFHD